MAWKIEREKRHLGWPLWRRWEYELILSSYGMVWGKALTERAAKRRLVYTQSDWFAEG